VSRRHARCHAVRKMKEQTFGAALYREGFKVREGFKLPEAASAKNRGGENIPVQRRGIWSRRVGMSETSGP
jgi:hypothetical protein